MKQVQISNAHSQYLDTLVSNGAFRSREEALRQALEYHKKAYVLETNPFQIDVKPADGGASKIQDDWIQFFNEQKQIMISAPIVYRAGQTGSKEVLASLRSDFDASWLVTSTRNSYNPSDLGARITQNYGSQVIAPKESKVLIPVYQGTALPKVLESAEGRKYLRAEFDTRDSPKKMIKTLEDLSEKDANNILVWTPTQENRRAYPERAVRFYCSVGQFLIYGSSLLLDNSGRSRRVFPVSPRSGPQKQ
jgi:hypothetical protein